MTETLIVKYSFILYSFKFLTSLPKIRDIKNNNMNVIFPRTVNVFHDSRSEIRLRRLYTVCRKKVPL